MAFKAAVAQSSSELSPSNITILSVALDLTGQQQLSSLRGIALTTATPTILIEYSILVRANKWNSLFIALTSFVTSGKFSEAVHAASVELNASPSMHTTSAGELSVVAVAIISHEPTAAPPIVPTPIYSTSPGARKAFYSAFPVYGQVLFPAGCVIFGLFCIVSVYCYCGFRILGESGAFKHKSAESSSISDGRNRQRQPYGEYNSVAEVEG